MIVFVYLIVFVIRLDNSYANLISSYANPIYRKPLHHAFGRGEEG